MTRGLVRDRDALVGVDGSGRRALALDLIEAAVAAVEPEASSRAAVERVSAAGLPLHGAVVVGMGKAAWGMARGALSVVRASRGVVVGPRSGAPAALGPLEVRIGPHPLPDETTLENGERLLDLAATVREHESVLCLVSGGGSAMVDALSEGVDLGALRRATALLLEASVPIEAINAVRRLVSRLKGGGLLHALRRARVVVTVVISDVPGGSPDLVASGPTLPPAGADGDPSASLPSGLLAALPSSVVAALRVPSTPRDLPLGHVEIAADGGTARSAIVAAALTRGLRAVSLDGWARGEARAAGRRFIDLARAADADVVAWGGETTVLVRGSGRGGRCQELALGALPAVGDALLAAFATDGTDGATDAAGALVDAHVVERASALGLDPTRALADNDSGTFFARAGGQIVTGPTGTNVADLLLYLR